MNYPILVAGFEGQDLSVESGGVWRRPRLLVGGQPAAPCQRPGYFMLRRNDGADVVGHFRTAFPDPTPVLMLGDQEIRFAPRLSPLECCWMGAPLLLLLVGGAIGGILGGCAVAANSRIFRASLTRSTKFALSGVVSFTCCFLWFGAVTVVSTALQAVAKPATAAIALQSTASTVTAPQPSQSFAAPAQVLTVTAPASPVDPNTRDSFNISESAGSSEASSTTDGGAEAASGGVGIG